MGWRRRATHSDDATIFSGGLKRLWRWNKRRQPRAMMMAISPSHFSSPTIASQKLLSFNRGRRSMAVCESSFFEASLSDGYGDSNRQRKWGRLRSRHSEGANLGP
ncbi:hypothetical protein Lalb_Chr20g0115051 [Lupinus albus]|uniref:Uncharacterized protein n=1 Tax=Lupinus albus TaxID=3870 RepID=A0A6A4NGD4_LUPAL|nr:hypothetical protein Lalb_Chr20g0115051 [Lupinus albus]